MCNVAHVLDFYPAPGIVSSDRAAPRSTFVQWAKRGGFRDTPDSPTRIPLWFEGVQVCNKRGVPASTTYPEESQLQGMLLTFPEDCRSINVELLGCGMY